MYRLRGKIVKTNINVTNFYADEVTFFDDGCVEEAQDFLDNEITKSNSKLDKDSIVLNYDEFIEPHYHNTEEGSIWDY